MREQTSPVALITKKRDGGEHSSAEIGELIRGFMNGDLADYQMSAWLMAAVLKGLSRNETLGLTEAMLNSGRVLSLGSVTIPKIDKHSTGGVGDKISLCLAPLVAASGVAVPMISGRGLGHTGGTLDKLEAIPGYRTALSEKEFERVVRKVGASIIGQTDKLAPADKRIYALRDVTGTVESIPLIVASILSKKLAEGIHGLVLDVKVGPGAFMKDLESGRALAKALVTVGRRAGRNVVALLTDMSAPVGVTIGNALETREALEVLHGAGPEDTIELTVELGAEMLLVAGVASGRSEGRRLIQRAIDNGAGLERMRRMVEAHGGDPSVVDDPRKLPRTKHRVAIPSSRGGYVRAIDSKALGLVAVSLGAGRRRAEDNVDPAVGIELGTQVGQRVEADQPLAWVHVRSRRDAARAFESVRQAFVVGRNRPKTRPRVLGRLTR